MSNPGFILHPEAANDIIEIWEYIASDSPDAARRVRESILKVSKISCRSPIRDTTDRISRAASVHPRERLPNCLRAR